MTEKIIKISAKTLSRAIVYLAFIFALILVAFSIMLIGLEVSTTVTEAMLSILGGTSFLIFGAIYLIHIEIAWFREDVIEEMKKK